MKFPVHTSPYGQLPNSVTRLMALVLLALVPGVAALVWYFGWGVMINIVIATTTAVAAEAVILRLRHHRVKRTLMDLSAVVTAVLLAISLPPLLPWWLTVLGTLFAIVFVKHLYGGLGYNPFNPAMAAYVLLLISFPVAMTRWLPPEILANVQLTFGQTLHTILTGHLPDALTWDAVTSATPLDEMRTQLEFNKTISEIRQSPLWGDFGARGWEWVGNWFLVGGLFLLWRKVIAWQIPAGMLAGLLLTAGLFWMFDPETIPFPGFHLFSGGMILGAFFIATDPVTASTTPRGRLIYGFLIGMTVFIIRTWGGYPDAVAFAVLLMNMAAPTIDYYTQPKVFGARKEEDG
ncbi:MAG: electron transport complex subunit RsxD [Gammaproteobacteria bacterium]|nr:MAG: electron transport complex subunit RsxD [Gammaproteobacteria bacterium]RTZ74239.1 MAG: electron transport complex subunit RsxD [Gammaproteobacteria bacterium]RTZ79696.1 MAG: electron transport complex subunit RsxD [Gammaproteobacteria bacterium]